MSDRRQRTRRIRRVTWAGGAALFAAAWLAVFVQLASGHDPGLRRQPAAPARPQQTPRLLLDPQTGQPVDPGAGGQAIPIDPQTGRPLPPQGGGPPSDPQAAPPGDQAAAAPGPVQTRQS